MNASLQLFLPFGLPSILPDIKTELNEFIECPANLPIYNIDNVQCYWPRKPDIFALLNAEVAPNGTSIKFKRDPITGEIGEMIEMDNQGTSETARNSMSMTRAPGPPAEGVRGTNFHYREVGSGQGFQSEKHFIANFFKDKIKPKL